MSTKSRRLAAVALIAVSSLLAASAASGTRPAVRTVHFRGTAYEFNNTTTRLGGATIRVVEFPKLHATVQRDGRYDLVVPDRATITPYIVDPGYHTIYLQTFTTGGEDLANVNFQTPTEPVYRGLVSLLKVPVDAQGNVVACAIVSTFNTRNVRDLTFAGFTAYGAHGVAGATATASPTLPRPVYFNQNVLPDPTQSASSIDGGVVWTGVPAGVYTITAHDPTTRFASFVATCRPGRVVNADPPWGIYQLGLPNPARVLAAWAFSGSHTTVTALRATHLPRGAVVRVRCTGHGCAFGSRTLRPTAATLDLRQAIGGAKLGLGVGDDLEVTVSAHTFNGLVMRWRAVNGHAPTRTVLCIPLGLELPRPHCPTS